MADRETIIAGGGDSGSGAIIAIVVLVIIAIGAYFLFFNRPGTAPSSVTVDVPAVTVPAPAAPAN
jgi:hypothetical protein